jgi:hypothetical protein
MDAEAAQKLNEDIGMITSPEALAREALRRHQAAMGMQFDSPDAAVMGPGPDDGLEPWMRGGGGQQ